MLKEIRERLKHPAPGNKPKFTVRDVMKMIYGRDIGLCPTCMEEALRVVEKWNRERSPPINVNVGLKNAV